MSSVLRAFGMGFDPNKVKPYLKMSIQRLQMLVNKKTNNIKRNQREIAKLLSEDKEEKARIRVEQVINEDFTIEAYEILELQCELIAERMRLIESEKECPADLDQAICTIVWAADRSEVAELAEVKKQFVKKYGSKFLERAMENESGCVNERVVKKLSITPPTAYLVQSYLKEIAAANNVDWEPADMGLPADITDAAMPGPTGFSVRASSGSGINPPLPPPQTEELPQQAAGMPLPGAGSGDANVAAIADNSAMAGGTESMSGQVAYAYPVQQGPDGSQVVVIPAGGYPAAAAAAATALPSGKSTPPPPYTPSADLQTAVTPATAPSRQGQGHGGDSDLATLAARFESLKKKPS